MRQAYSGTHHAVSTTFWNAFCHAISISAVGIASPALASTGSDPATTGERLCLWPGSRSLFFFCLRNPTTTYCTVFLRHGCQSPSNESAGHDGIDESAATVALPPYVYYTHGAIVHGMYTILAYPMSAWTTQYVLCRQYMTVQYCTVHGILCRHTQ